MKVKKGSKGLWKKPIFTCYIHIRTQGPIINFFDGRFQSRHDSRRKFLWRNRFIKAHWCINPNEKSTTIIENLFWVKTYHQNLNRLLNTKILCLCPGSRSAFNEWSKWLGTLISIIYCVQKLVLYFRPQNGASLSIYECTISEPYFLI